MFGRCYLPILAARKRTEENIRPYCLSFLFPGALLLGSLAQTGETAQAKTKRALSAAPPDIAKASEVADRDDKGNITVLRDGNHGFPCFPRHRHSRRRCHVRRRLRRCSGSTTRCPINRSQRTPNPGLLTGWPEAQAGAGAIPPPRQALRSKNRRIGCCCGPFAPATTGLPTTPKQTGTWIMYAGTPWAHLNQPEAASGRYCDRKASSRMGPRRAERESLTSPDTRFCPPPSSTTPSSPSSPPEKPSKHRGPTKPDPRAFPERLFQ